MPEPSHKNAVTTSGAENTTCNRRQLYSAPEEGYEIGIDEDVDNYIRAAHKMTLTDEIFPVSLFVALLEGV